MTPKISSSLPNVVFETFCDLYSVVFSTLRIDSGFQSSFPRTWSLYLSIRYQRCTFAIFDNLFPYASVPEVAPFNDMILSLDKLSALSSVMDYRFSKERFQLLEWLGATLPSIIT